MVVGYLGLVSSVGKTNQEWLRHTLGKWLAEHDATLGITRLLMPDELEFAKICARQSIPFRVVLSAPGPQPISTKAAPLLQQAQATHVADDGRPETLVLANCDVLLVSSAAAISQEIDQLLQSHCRMGRAALIFDTATKQKYIHCNPHKIE